MPAAVEFVIDTVSPSAKIDFDRNEPEHETFYREARTALIRVTDRTFNPEEATDFQKQVHSQIQNTVCELMNAMYVQETSGMGTGISSVSNDGYSESYKITTAAEREAQLLVIIRGGLSGTGLVSAL